MRLLTLVIFSTLSLTLVADAAAQSPEDVEAITRAALDYGEGWYEADAERMARALHPELAKRMIYTDSRNGRSRLSQMGAMTLVENTRAGGGKTPRPALALAVVVNLSLFRLICC